MDNILSIPLFVGIVVLAIINWIIYHRIFTVYYGNIGQGCLKEIIGCWFAALFEIGLVVAIFKGIGGVIGNILMWIFRIIFWGILIILALYVIAKIIAMFKKSPTNGVTGSNSQTDKQENRIVTDETGVTSMKYCSNCGKENLGDAKFCVSCGTKMIIEAAEHQNVTTDDKLQEVKKYIADNYDESTKVSAIQKYRELTGTGLKEAKDAVDLILMKKVK